MALWGKKDKKQAREAEGNAIGLTQAFAPVGDFDEYGEFGEDDFAGFDKFSAFDDEDDFADAGAPIASVASEDTDAPVTPSVGALEEPASKRGRHARHAAKVAVSADVEVDEADSFDEDDDFDDIPRGRHAVGAHARQVSAAADSEQPAGGVELSVLTSDADAAWDAGANADPAEEIPAYMRKSRKTRRILTVAIVLLVILLAAGGFFAWQLVQTAANSASQQVQTHESSSDIQGSEASDASAISTKKTTAPNLVSLMGMTQDEAVEALQHGAQVSSTAEVNEAGSPVKTEVRVALTAEPADSRAGTPTVYLGLDKDGKVVQAGYSTSTSSLGYGALSFSDAVKNEHIIENTLGEVGVTVEDGAVVLPEDKMAYSTYGSDGKTLVKEYCPFSGTAEVDGVTYEWSSVLSYDYSTANATGNLADTVRLIYVYVNK